MSYVITEAQETTEQEVDNIGTCVNGQLAVIYDGIMMNKMTQKFTRKIYTSPR